MTIKQLQKKEEKLEQWFYKKLGKEGMKKLAQYLEIEILLEAECNK